MASGVPTFEQFQRALRGTPMQGEARGIYDASLRYGINPAFTAGLAGAESNFGRAGGGANRHNPYGFGAHDNRGFPSWTAATEAMGKGLRDPKGYYKNAHTLAEFINIYSPPSENDTAQHIRNITSIGRRTGGNPTQMIIGAPNAGTAAAPQVAQAPSGVQAPAPQGQRQQSIEAALALGPQIMGTNPNSPLLQMAIATQQGMENSQPSMGGGGATPQGAGIPTEQDNYTYAPLPRSANQPGLSQWGGPADHGARALGNWQSDNAYDLGGKTGTVVTSPLAGRVSNISGQPGGDPGFAGYGVTVDYGGGRQAFYKHLGALGPGIRKGSSVARGQSLGGLDATTSGGPHLHLGANKSGFLKQILSYYTGGK